MGAMVYALLNRLGVGLTLWPSITRWFPQIPGNRDAAARQKSHTPVNQARAHSLSDGTEQTGNEKHPQDATHRVLSFRCYIPFTPACPVSLFSSVPASPMSRRAWTFYLFQWKFSNPDLLPPSTTHRISHLGFWKHFKNIMCNHIEDLSHWALEGSSDG